MNLLGLISVSKQGIVTHLEQISNLKVTPKKVIKDSSFLTINLTERVISKGFEKSWIIEDFKNFYSCSCGKTEFLEEKENLFERKSERTVYKIVNNTPICKFCYTEAVKYFEKVLLLRVPIDILISNKIIFAQNYFKKDFENQLKELLGKDILISRKKSRGVSIFISNKLYYIDPDFIYMMYLYYLYEMDYCVDIFIIGSKIAKQTAMTLIVSSLMNIKLPHEIIAVPYFSFSNNLDIDTNKFLTMYGGETLRLILSSSFGCCKKEIKVNSDLIYQVQQSLNIKDTSMVYQSKNSVDLIQIWHEYSIDKIMRLISSLRKPSVKLNEQDKLILKCLIG